MLPIISRFYNLKSEKKNPTSHVLAILGLYKIDLRYFNTNKNCIFRLINLLPFMQHFR